MAVGALPVPLAATFAGVDTGPLCIDLDATLVVAHSDDYYAYRHVALNVAVETADTSDSPTGPGG